MKDLIQRYLQAQAAEQKAKATRIELTHQIADALEHPEEGQKTHKVDGYKITVKQKINRRVDWDGFDAAMSGSKNPAPCIIKRELDIKGLRWYADNDPDRYFELTKSITEKPGLPSVEVKEITK